MIIDTSATSYPLTILSFGGNLKRSSVVVNGKAIKQTSKIVPALGYAIILMTKNGPGTYLGGITPFPDTSGKSFSDHIIEHYKEASTPRIPKLNIVFVAWTQGMWASHWNENAKQSDIDFLKSWGAGAAFDDLLQKVNKLPSCTGNFSYCLASKLEAINEEGNPKTQFKWTGISYEAADTGFYPNAGLSLSLLPLQYAAPPNAYFATVLEIRETD